MKEENDEEDKITVMYDDDGTLEIHTIESICSRPIPIWKKTATIINNNNINDSIIVDNEDEWWIVEIYIIRVELAKRKYELYQRQINDNMTKVNTCLHLGAVWLYEEASQEAMNDSKMRLFTDYNTMAKQIQNNNE